MICGIKAANDVSCEVRVRSNPFDSGFQTVRTTTTLCEFNDDIEITEPLTLSNSVNENVTELVMRRNKKIEFLPKDLIVTFPNLKGIDAFGSSVKSINKLNFYGLTKLIKIVLDDNNIEAIDENSFVDLINLEYLYLDNNKITDLSPKLFANLENLDTLYLNGNQLTKLDPELLKNNNKIALLHINDNNLRTLPAGFLDGLTRMRQLWLKNNEIIDLPSHIFDQCESLIDVDLSSNRIKTIDPNLLSKLTELREVSFSFNPIDFIDLAIFDENTNLSEFFFNGIATTDIRNIEKVDKMANIKGLGFHDGCVGDQFHERNLDKLKDIVKARCSVPIKA